MRFLDRNSCRVDAEESTRLDMAASDHIRSCDEAEEILRFFFVKKKKSHKEYSVRFRESFMSACGATTNLVQDRNGSFAFFQLGLIFRFLAFGFGNQLGVPWCGWVRNVLLRDGSTISMVSG
jgi:hypothetical protein